MPTLHVEPRVLADAGRSLATQRSVLADVAGALDPTFAQVAVALPGSRTAQVAGETGAALASAVRSVAAELEGLAGALTAASREYTAVERSAAAGLERAHRRPM
jgi:hypothetical protein